MVVQAIYWWGPWGTFVTASNTRSLHVATLCRGTGAGCHDYLSIVVTDVESTFISFLTEQL